MGPTGCPETSVTINLLCVTSQKNEYLIYTQRQPGVCCVGSLFFYLFLFV